MPFVGAAGAAPLGRPLNGRLPQIGLGKLWGVYCTSLIARPLLTKSCTSLAGFCLGDFIAQSASRRSNKVLAEEPYDVQRTLRLAFYGGCVAGPLGHYWFNFLDKVLITSTDTVSCTSADVDAHLVLLQAVFPEAMTR